MIKGDCTSRLPFYTAGGSFWMNHTTRFLATVSEEDKGHTRNLCNQEGYESVALIPIRSGDQILGLIHIADPQENKVPLEVVEMLEKAALQLGTAFGRVNAETALRESEAKYRLLVNQIPAVVFKGYRDWNVDFFDRKIEDLTGYPKEAFDSRQLKWRDLILPEDLEVARGSFRQALKTDKSYVREYRLRKKNGGIAWIQARGQIFCDAPSKVDYVSGLFFDITERKVLEAQLLQAQKMEAVGRLAGGVAHDFNNLLMAIMGYSELIRTSLLKDDPLYKYSEDILKASERAASLTQQLLAFSRQQRTFKYLYEGALLDYSYATSAPAQKVDIATEAPTVDTSRTNPGTGYCNGWQLLVDLPSPVGGVDTADTIRAYLEPMHSAVQYGDQGAGPGRPPGRLRSGRQASEPRRASSSGPRRRSPWPGRL